MSSLRNLICLLVGSLAFLGTSRAASVVAGQVAPPSPVNLSAPSLARTATTAVLLWDRPADAQGITSYQIFCDGRLAGETSHLSFTLRNLEAGGSRRVTVRSRNLNGRTSDETDPVIILTKPAGAILNVRDYGALGDGVTKDTSAIQKAIDACPVGGTVLVPPGLYLVDHLDLKSDMTLEVFTGATLQFLGRGLGEYPTTIEMLPGPDGDVAHPNFGLISAVRAHRLTITGGGRINGNGESWWPHSKLGPRPRVLKFIGCSDLFVQGVTLEDPPAWNTHVVYVDRAVFSEVTFLKVSTVRGSNGDGLNPDSSRDILIVGCRFGNQDDSIAIKSGRISRETSRRQRSTENITIRDSVVDGTLAPGSHPLGFAIGSENCGGIRHVLIKDCVFRNAASVINLKSNRERLGAVVEDIRVENCNYTNTVFGDEPWNRAPLAIDLFYYRLPSPPDSVEPPTPATPLFRNIHFRNITIDNPKGRFAYFCGLAEQPAQNITLENVTGTAKTGLHGQNLVGITLRNVVVVSQDGDPFVWSNTRNRKVLSDKPVLGGTPATP
jgi:exo-poly-alpha-galacturonosidase